MLLCRERPGSGWWRRHDLKRFSEDLQTGDLVVLHAGKHGVRAIGEVASGYLTHSAFADIDGADYSHLRRVHWFWQAPEPVPLPGVPVPRRVTLWPAKSERLMEWLRLGG